MTGTVLKNTKNTETMQAPSPRKKPKFFCSSVIVYAFFEKNARIIFDNFKKPYGHSNQNPITICNFYTNEGNIRIMLNRKTVTG
jgi:hypothetical protein